MIPMTLRDLMMRENTTAMLDEKWVRSEEHNNVLIQLQKEISKEFIKEIGISRKAKQIYNDSRIKEIIDSVIAKYYKG
jgi:hypothetical protein